eukprot:690618-Rhodomonas_salina.1
MSASWVRNNLTVELHASGPPDAASRMRATLARTRKYVTSWLGLARRDPRQTLRPRPVRAARSPPQPRAQPRAAAALPRLDAPHPLRPAPSSRGSRSPRP